ncbi:hypothetical protein SPFM12_00132 [Salmonella phage SPFM12]|nr:hypothetical protein SPFM12_00132 [Salmonella phage SPFM12]
MSIILNITNTSKRNLSQVTLIDSAEKERDPESGLVLVRGSAPTDSSSPASIYGSGSAYQGKGFLCHVYPFGDCIPNKQMLPNWTNISLRNADHDDLEYGRCEYNDLMRLLRGLTDGDEPTVMTLDDGDLAGVDQSGLFEWQGDTYRDIYNAGLVYGVDGFGPDNGRKVYYMMNSGGRFNSTLYSWNALTGMSGTGTLIMNKFYRHGLGQLPFEEQMTYDALPAGFRRRGVGGVDQINYSDTDDLALTVTVNGRTVGSPQKSIVIKNGETEWTDETVILNTRYWYLFRGTAKINTAALPAPIATLSKMAFTLRWKNENPAGSIVNIYHLKQI